MNPHPEVGYRALRKGRYSATGNAYLVTTVTDKRIDWFRDSSLASIVARSLASADKTFGTRTVCWVVMPDHVHWLMQLGELTIEKTVNRFKGASARAVNARLRRRGRLWFPGFHEHALRRHQNLRMAARYVLANPLRAGLVARLGDYPFWDADWL